MNLVSPQFVVNPGPIIGAGSRGSIRDTSNPMPNVSNSLRGWFKPIIIGIMTTVIQDGTPIPKIEEIATSGILQPGDPEKLDIKAEGSRSWNNYTLHVLPGLNLNTFDVIKINDTVYTIMNSTDYADYGYTIFSLLEGYQNGRT